MGKPQKQSFQNFIKIQTQLSKNLQYLVISKRRKDIIIIYLQKFLFPVQILWYIGILFFPVGQLNPDNENGMTPNCFCCFVSLKSVSLDYSTFEESLCRETQIVHLQVTRYYILCSGRTQKNLGYMSPPPFVTFVLLVTMEQAIVDMPPTWQLQYGEEYFCIDLQ